MKIQQLHIQVSPQIYEQLRKRAFDRHTSMSKLIRLAIIEHLIRENDPRFEEDCDLCLQNHRLEAHHDN